MSEYIDVPGTVPPQKVVNSGRPVTAITNPDGSQSLVGPGGPISYVGPKYLAESIVSGARLGAKRYLDPLGSLATSFVSEVLDSVARAIWERRVAALKPGNTYQANIGTVVYIDPTSPTNGAGTLSSPRNNLPAFADNQTLLLKSGTVHPPIGMGTRTNWLLGTYNPTTGAREFEPDRLAIIDGAGGIAVNMSGAQVNTWVSGVKVRNYTAGILKGRNAGASGGGVEFCADGGALYSIV